MIKLLVVDRVDQNADLISQSLASAGYEILTADSGNGALAKLTLFKPDIIILSDDLPDISGYDVCKRIKTNPDTKMSLVLFTSNLESPEIRFRAIEVGADDYIDKNFSSVLLISKINSLMRVKHLSDQLKQKYTELEEKNNVIELQLKMARQVQRVLMPDLNTSIKDIRVASQYIPALDIGGDFYNLFQINDNQVCIVLGDVSGHGISAALLTSMINMMVRSLANKYKNPDQLLFYLNNELYNMLENSALQLYACVFYAVFDVREKVLMYSNAGQALPVFIDSANKTAKELVSSGVPIGMMKDSIYEFKKIEYKKGDILALRTDGISDIFFKDAPDEFTGRYNDLLLEMMNTDNLNEIIDALLEAFYDYSASETDKYVMDDVSLIVCKM